MQGFHLIKSSYPEKLAEYIDVVFENYGRLTTGATADLTANQVKRQVTIFFLFILLFFALFIDKTCLSCHNFEGHYIFRMISDFVHSRLGISYYEFYNNVANYESETRQRWKYAARSILFT